ncbi:DNA-binding transcriptional regulator, AcrR family [Catalinimonas alkaloidigena]|uniref:DNA-binding transcriptional regulator, AcrR family n=1 Tax=Catalinimonas alkaloidigena TaxID=1075417 RepID=A0A1G9MQD2_9BACT|nr:TetR/AcrR family transcriptional regulator [Catalinimonas alkaloidigena]SDL76324.1 DNA-binding transcriptional regulator, AcrR family [Catalinimonas alkaloidigena]
MGIVERKEREKLEMRERILETATHIFIEEGYEKASIRKIADRIEYSPATIYLYFKDKNELFYAIQEQAFTFFLEHLNQSDSIENPFDRLFRMGELYVEFARKHPEYYDLMFIMRAPMKHLKEDNQDEWDQGFACLDCLRHVVNACMAQGLLKPMPTEVATLSIWSFMHGLVSLAIRERCSMYPEEVFPTLMQESIKQFLNNMRA